MTECVYCGQAEGHSPRCSVTKFGVADVRWDGERRNALAENDRLRKALERIASLDYDPLRHESARTVAREALRGDN